MVLYLHPHSRGTLAQMVEQWTENPCVPGSIPGGTTKPTQKSGFFVFIYIDCLTFFTYYILNFHPNSMLENRMMYRKEF